VNDAWWQEQRDLAISRSTRACHRTVLQSEKELGFRVECVACVNAWSLVILLDIFAFSVVCFINVVLKRIYQRCLDSERELGLRVESAWFVRVSWG